MTAPAKRYEVTAQITKAVYRPPDELLLHLKGPEGQFCVVVPVLRDSQNLPDSFWDELAKEESP